MYINRDHLLFAFLIPFLIPYLPTRTLNVNAIKGGENATPKRAAFKFISQTRTNEFFSVYYRTFFRSLKCTRIRLHIHLFISLALNNITWIVWYEEVIFLAGDGRLLENPVSVHLLVVVVKYSPVLYVQFMHQLIRSQYETL